MIQVSFAVLQQLLLPSVNLNPIVNRRNKDHYTP